MKRVLSMLFLLVPFVILGCSQKEVRFDHTVLKEEIKEEGTAPKLPTNISMTIAGYERVIPPHEPNISEVVFKGGEGGMQVSVTTQSTPVTYLYEYKGV